MAAGPRMICSETASQPTFAELFQVLPLFVTNVSGWKTNESDGGLLDESAGLEGTNGTPPTVSAGSSPDSVAVSNAAAQAFYVSMRYYVYHVITPTVFLVGVIGNVVSLVVGSRRFRRG